MGASDLHLTINVTDAYYQFRVDGAMTPRFTLNVSEAKDMMSSAVQTKMSGFTGIDRQDRVINLPIEDIYCTYVDPYSGTRKAEYVDVRISRTPINAAKGQLYVGRIQPNSSERPYSDLSSIGLPESIQTSILKILNKPSGAFIVAGKVNCGKNTTLTACLERLPHDQSGVSIEDPIEYKLHHPNFRQIQVDGTDPELSMGARLTDVLRQDPNFISVAEMRTAVVAEEVIKHSRLGHLMFTTVHAADALTVYPRLLDLGITENTLIEEDIIAGILSQQLVPKLCHNCKIPYHDNALNKKLFKANKSGCEECRTNIRSGFQFGRKLICELFIPDETHVDFILSQDWRGLRKHFVSQGWKLMGDWAMEYIVAGELDYDATKPLIPQLDMAKQRLSARKGELFKEVSVV
jgi:type II secretory ATPase GspE/PulE/Tfp pilus assembly ATPase PilB-like protein